MSSSICAQISASSEEASSSSDDSPPESLAPLAGAAFLAAAGGAVIFSLAFAESSCGCRAAAKRSQRSAPEAGPSLPSARGSRANWQARASVSTDSLLSCQCSGKPRSISTSRTPMYGFSARISVPFGMSAAATYPRPRPARSDAILIRSEQTKSTARSRDCASEGCPSLPAPAISQKTRLLELGSVVAHLLALQPGWSLRYSRQFWFRCFQVIRDSSCESLLRPDSSPYVRSMSRTSVRWPGVTRPRGSDPAAPRPAACGGEDEVAAIASKSGLSSTRE
mmetsp:Transcript_86634/g.245665  ORF Transcript_86634/g.245665 Transcript_86634/m.245665 type:complete len:280 (+) Transcript_86634:338-1177(+)